MRCFPRRLLRRAALRRRNFGTETEGPEIRELDPRTPKGMENAVPWWSIFAIGFEVGSWEFDRFSLTTLSIG